MNHGAGWCIMRQGDPAWLLVRFSGRDMGQRKACFAPSFVSLRPMETRISVHGPQVSGVTLFGLSTAGTFEKPTILCFFRRPPTKRGKKVADKRNVGCSMLSSSFLSWIGLNSSTGHGGGFCLKSVAIRMDGIWQSCDGYRPPPLGDEGARKPGGQMAFVSF